MSTGRYRIGVDVGGTFTDFVLIDVESGELAREKCLTTPDDPVAGIMNGIERLIASGAVTAPQIEGIAHATTLVTNTLIERKGAPTGLLTTEGFRDSLELGSDMRYDMYDLAIEFPEPLVPRNWRLGITERVTADNQVLQSPQPSEIRRKVRGLIKDGVNSVAICFLHSYRNPAHERHVAKLLAKEFPQIEVSISSQVAPEIREYERAVTTVANAYVKPVVRSYLNRLGGSLKAVQINAPVLVMLSNGGMTTPATAGDVPIRLVESGPAAGVLSACHAGARINEPNLLAFDMGGTTAKACFISDGQPAFTGTFEAARVKRQFRGSGFPLKVPSLEMIEIGAGGGSIARVDGTGLMKVGPDSAGAKPGPVCYGLGGTNPTVTDADLVLGYLDPKYFLGGDMKLNVEASQAAIAALGKRCGLGAIETAAGIARIVNQNMATAVRIHAAERGKDYRRYALFAFGGAGPVHAYELARILKLTRLICPLGAGTNSAFGLLAAPVAVDLSRSYTIPLHEMDWKYLNQLCTEMEREAATMLADAGIKKPQLARSADMRFVGQGFELAVPVPAGKLGTNVLEQMKEAFHREYRKVYDNLPGDLPVEAITWRLRASGPQPKVADAVHAREKSTAAPKHRKVYFPELGGFTDTVVLDRYAMQAGDTLTGPAVIEERESTLVIGPRSRGSIDADLNLVVQISD